MNEKNPAKKYPIENTIPIPDGMGAGNRECKFPFSDMTQGDSFFVPMCDDTPDNVRSAASRFTKLHPTFKFITRRTTLGIRVWRTQ